MSNTNFLKKLLLLVLFALTVTNGQAQRVALKTNPLYWMTLSPNIGLEFRLSQHFTLNMDAAFNPFKINDKLQTRFVGVAPEVRYWFVGRPQAKHFIGVMGLGSSYSFILKNNLHEGGALGAGLTYGYSFVLSTRWSLETTVGTGVLSINEKKYRKGEDIPGNSNRSKVMFAPLKIGVSFVYLLK